MTPHPLHTVLIQYQMHHPNGVYMQDTSAIHLLKCPEQPSRVEMSQPNCTPVTHTSGFWVLGLCGFCFLFSLPIIQMITLSLK